MPADLTPALTILRREIADLAAVYLFGSAAAGTDRPDSEVDIAIFAGRSLDRLKLLDTQKAIAKAVGRDVDLIDLAAASTILQMQVIGEGKLIDAPHPDAAAFFEVRVMREYQDLMAARARAEITSRSQAGAC